MFTKEAKSKPMVHSEPPNGLAIKMAIITSFKVYSKQATI
jgi:hypothetical protein